MMLHKRQFFGLSFSSVSSPTAGNIIKFLKSYHFILYVQNRSEKQKFISINSSLPRLVVIGVYSIELLLIVPVNIYQ